MIFPCTNRSGACSIISLAADGILLYCHLRALVPLRQSTRRDRAEILRRKSSLNDPQPTQASMVSGAGDGITTVMRVKLG